MVQSFENVCEIIKAAEGLKKLSRSGKRLKKPSIGEFLVSLMNNTFVFFNISTDIALIRSIFFYAVKVKV